MNKTVTKAQVIKFIKEHGVEGAFEWTATINGIKVGLCKSTIILYNEGYKFPTFHKVNLIGDELEFETNRGHGRTNYNIFVKEDRSRDIVDKYYKVMEGIMNA